MDDDSTESPQTLRWDCRGLGAPKEWGAEVLESMGSSECTKYSPRQDGASKSIVTRKNEAIFVGYVRTRVQPFKNEPIWVWLERAGFVM